MSLVMERFISVGEQSSVVHYDIKVGSYEKIAET